MDLSRLFHPASVAVVGATERHGSYAAQTLLNLETAGFAGSVWGVNPGRRSVFGHPCVPTLADLPEPADAVVVAIPAAGVPDAIEQAGATGCGGAVVLSAGFREVASGRTLEASLVDAARRYDLPVCGPNCNGIVVARTGLTLWGDVFVRRDPGAVALVSQSGNVAVNALATARGLRFHTVIASGNQAVLSAADYLAHLAGEDGVGAIALYLEDDGGPRLCDGLAACAEAGIRIAVLKVGSSPAGARAAAAHSGALAGDQRVFRSVLEEAGAVWADDVHDLLELVKTLSSRLRPPRPGVAIMTCSGGDSAQGADECARLGLPLPELAPATRERLRALLPSAATVANPLDYTAMLWGDGDALAALVVTLGEDPEVGTVLVFYDQPPAMAGALDESWAAVRDGIMAGAARSPVPALVASTLPELLDDASAWRFQQAGVPAVAGLRTGLRCVAALGAVPAVPGRLRSIGALARSVSVPVVDRLEWLSEHASKQLLRAAGLPVVEGRVVLDAADAVAAFGELGPVVAVKVSAPSVQHKSELGAVELGLSSVAGVQDAFARLAPLAAQYDGSVLVERFAPGEAELLIAARADTVVPALVIGLGGIWAELLDDVAVVPLPASPERVERALRRLRGAPLLFGGRGGRAVDVGAVCRLAARAGELLAERSLALIELNPVVVGASGALALDALVGRPRSAGEPGGVGAHRQRPARPSISRT